MEDKALGPGLLDWNPATIIDRFRGMTFPIWKDSCQKGGMGQVFFSMHDLYVWKKFGNKNF